MNARAIINQQRRKLALLDLAVFGIAFMTAWLLWSGWSLLAIALAFAISRFAHLWDRCPSCQAAIDELPSERTRLLPELKHAIRMCPYCGHDLSYQPESVEAPAQPAQRGYSGT